MWVKYSTFSRRHAVNSFLRARLTMQLVPAHAISLFHLAFSYSSAVFTVIHSHTTPSMFGSPKPLFGFFLLTFLTTASILASRAASPNHTNLPSLLVLPTTNDTRANPANAIASPDTWYPYASTFPTISIAPPSTSSDRVPSNTTSSLGAPKIICNGTRYGRNLRIASCVTALGRMDATTGSRSYGQRDADPPGPAGWDAKLPLRILSCESTPSHLFYRLPNPLGLPSYNPLSNRFQLLILPLIPRSLGPYPPLILPSSNSRRPLRNRRLPHRPLPLRHHHPFATKGVRPQPHRRLRRRHPLPRRRLHQPRRPRRPCLARHVVSAQGALFRRRDGTAVVLVSGHYRFDAGRGEEGEVRARGGCLG